VKVVNIETNIWGHRKRGRGSNRGWLAEHSKTL
jgi:hypothetical protein